MTWNRPLKRFRLTTIAGLRLGSLALRRTADLLWRLSPLVTKRRYRRELSHAGLEAVIFGDGVDMMIQQAKLLTERTKHVGELRALRQELNNSNRLFWAAASAAGQLRIPDKNMQAFSPQSNLIFKRDNGKHLTIVQAVSDSPQSG